MKAAKKKVGADVFTTKSIVALLDGMQEALKGCDLRDSEFRRQLLAELVAAYVASQGGSSADVRWAVDGLLQSFNQINRHLGKTAQDSCQPR